KLTPAPPGFRQRALNARCRALGAGGWPEAPTAAPQRAVQRRKGVWGAQLPTPVFIDRSGIAWSYFICRTFGTLSKIGLNPMSLATRGREWIEH
ncbi:MAG: hypothetical protein ACLQVJ_02380, partial [Syntrophobacteraceae bacterium]